MVSEFACGTSDVVSLAGLALHAAKTILSGMSDLSQQLTVTRMLPLEQGGPCSPAPCSRW
jgi:hypothetical protein